MNFTSIFGSKKPITASQYIAELICKKYAEHSKQHLPDKFWDKELHEHAYDDWVKRYKTEIIGANRLLKLYKAESIIASLKHKHAKWIFSLYNKNLPPIIIEEERRIIAEKELSNSTPKIERSSIDSLPVVKSNNISKIDKLRD